MVKEDVLKWNSKDMQSTYPQIEWPFPKKEF